MSKYFFGVSNETNYCNLLKNSIICDYSVKAFANDSQWRISLSNFKVADLEHSPIIRVNGSNEIVINTTNNQLEDIKTFCLNKELKLDFFDSNQNLLESLAFVVKKIISENNQFLLFAQV